MDEAHADNGIPNGASRPAAAPQAAKRAEHPPKPRFALTVGIVGHKLKFWTDNEAWKEPPSAEERLKKVVASVEAALAAIKAAVLQSTNDHAAHFKGEKKDGRYIAEPPILTLASALADGADTIAADAALKLGYQLDAPLPFARDDYENDFASETRDHFKQLLGQARAVLELPGRRASVVESSGDSKIELNRAYESAGLTVVSQADIVLAVWDGAPARGRGGTAELVAEAARAGIPIVLIDANGILPIEVRWRGLMEEPAPVVAIDDLERRPLDQCIQRVVDDLIRLPASQEVGYAQWCKERRHCLNLCMAFPLLTTVLGTRPIKWHDIAPRGPETLADADYVALAKPVIADERKRVAPLADPYGWADGVAFHFAQVFRSAFVTNFLFAAFAVMFALVSVFFLYADATEPTNGEGPWWHSFLSWAAFCASHHWPVAIEIVLIGSVVGVTWVGRRRRWHPRWVEPREVAERLRGALPLWSLGLRPASFPGEEPTWTGWYTRALVRAQGLRAGKIAAGASWIERNILLDLLRGQAGYNRANVARMRSAEQRLEAVGFMFFFATASALPAFATATYGIRIIGDFEGTAHRNEHTWRSIDELVAAIEQDPPDFALLRARARTAADILLGDVQSWRLSAESRGLAIPG